MADDETATDATPDPKSSLTDEVHKEDVEDKEDGNGTTSASEEANDTDPPHAQPNSTNNGKVKVHFVAVGSAPIMKKTKFQISRDQRFVAVTQFLRKMLKMTDSGGSLFLYCNSAFVPSPDELVGDLNDCFSIRGELVIHYSLQEAWG